MSSNAGTLGKYQIIREIARSNDIVYEAYDPLMNRRVALKELAVPAGASEKQREERLARFKREAKAAGSLSHPNILTIYEVDEDRGRAYIAMEYLEGSTLRQRIDVDGGLGQDEAVRIILEVLAGLAYAHENGVVHRDIKPDNIQLLPDGRVKITDFGIARLMFEPSLTIDGQIFGTPSYMSPEQVEGRDVDARTDIWSCGVVLYEAIGGAKPFTGDSVVSISHAIMRLEPNDPPGASYAVAQVIKRSLDKASSERYPSAKAMATALNEAMTSLRDTPPSPPPVPTVTPAHAYPASGYPYGQPYGQPYGAVTGQQPPPIISPFPPGWTAPPSKPLLSPATWLFIHRTLAVIFIGSVLVGLGFWGVAALSKSTESHARIKADLARAQQLRDKGGSARNAAASQEDLVARIGLLRESLDDFSKAADVAPTEQGKNLALEEAARTALKLCREYNAAGSSRDAEIAAQNAIRYADACGATDIGNQARTLQQQIDSGG